MKVVLLIAALALSGCAASPEQRRLAMKQHSNLELCAMKYTSPRNEDAAREELASRSRACDPTEVATFLRVHRAQQEANARTAQQVATSIQMMTVKAPAPYQPIQSTPQNYTPQILQSPQTTCQTAMSGGVLRTVCN